MASVFNKQEDVKTMKTVDIVRNSLDVDETGMVRFRSRVGRGSGRAVEIPGEQFDEFVSLMVEAKKRREELARQCQTEPTTTEESNVVE